MNKKHFLVQLQNLTANNRTVNIFSELQKSFNSHKIVNIKVDSITFHFTTSAVAGDRYPAYRIYRSNQMVSDVRCNTAFSTINSDGVVCCGSDLFNEALTDGVFNLPLQNFNFDSTDLMNFFIRGAQAGDVLTKIFIAGSFDYKSGKK